MHDGEAVASNEEHARQDQLGLVEQRLGSALQKAFGQNASGRLQVMFPSGRSVTAGAPAGPVAYVSVKSLACLWKLFTRGSLGLAESYMRDEIDTPDLKAVLTFLNSNYNALERAGGGIAKPRMLDVFWHRRRDNSRKGSRKNIAAHYDLGNAFYELWLDPSMTYSSAIFRERAATLEQAQDEKYARVLGSLGLSTGDRVLEIGCGWGGFAERAARLGVHVTGLTVSREQLDYARERMARKGLSEFCDLRFEDYRDCSGHFDAIASIEMIEAVGEAHWPKYFKTIAERLKSGGAAALQAITIQEKYFPAYRRQADFIQRYIFPGGMLPTIERMQAEAEAAGLEFETVERFGQSYAKTLSIWRQRFLAAWADIERLGFDDRFRRMWLYYLVYCEVAFESGDVDVGIYKLSKPRTG